MTASQADRADELGDRVNGHPEHADEVLPQLEAILGQPDDARSSIAAIEALACVWEARAAEVLLRHVPVEHPDSEVRFALARSLPCGVDGDAPVFTDVVRALVALSTDSRDDVREWACFGLGQLEADSPAVRDALAARLADDCPDARCEALVALAALGDERVLEPCRRALEVDPGDVWLLALHAAAALGDGSLLPPLEALRAAWADDAPDRFSVALDEAMRSCSRRER